MGHSLSTSISAADVVLALIALVTVLVAFFLAVRYTLRPGEESPVHIKRRILEDGGEELE